MHPSVLELLSADDRSILQRVDLDGATQTALAEQEGVPLSTIKSRVQRARSRLRRLFDQCCKIEVDRRGSPTGYVRRSAIAAPACPRTPATTELNIAKHNAME